MGCTLDYWDEDCGVFSVLEEFRLSETTPTEVLVSRLVGSRKWRIAVVEVEWEDDEEGERFVGRLVTTLLSFIAYFLSPLSLFHSLIILQTFSAPDFRADLVDEGGSPIPLASILSPVSLAGCTCVDSTFSPQFVPVSDFSLTCHSMQVTLIHITPSNPGSVQLKYQSSYRNSVELNFHFQVVLKVNYSFIYGSCFNFTFSCVEGTCSFYQDGLTITRWRRLLVECLRN